jgi:hypothetical protein
VNGSPARAGPGEPAAGAAPRRSRWETLALVLLFGVAVGVTVRLLFATDLGRQNVYLKVFVPAAEAFVAGQDLYVDRDSFRYPPLAAALFVPFAACGPLLGSILWRLVMWALFLLALRATFGAGFPMRLSSRERAVFLLGLMPMAAANVNMGQPNLLVLTALLWATVRVRDAGTIAPSAAVVSATAIKVYPLAHGLVLAALRPRLLWWLLPLLAVSLLLPFLLQHPHYVWRQYVSLFDMLSGEDRTLPDSTAFAYRDLRILVTAVGVNMPQHVFRLLQVIGGGSIVVLCWVLRRRRIGEARLLDHAFALTMCWFMLLGPSTEKVTYVLLAPTLLWGAIEAWRHGGRVARSLWAVAVFVFLLDQILPAPSRRADGIAAARPGPGRSASTGWARGDSPGEAVVSRPCRRTTRPI